MTEIENKIPNKQQFDKLLFSKRHNLLEAIVRTLVTQQRQNRSTEYAKIISNYFKTHGRFMELLMWSIDIDFLSTDTLSIDPSSFHYSTFFIPFYNQFVNYYFKNYLLDIFEPYIDGLSTNGEYSEEFKIAMDLQSKEFTSVDDVASYQQSLESIAKIFCKLNESIIHNAQFLPDFIKMFFTKFFDLLHEGEIEEEMCQKIFNELFFTYTICQNINDPFLLMYEDDKRTQLVPIIWKLEFIALVIQNHYTNNSLCEGFMIDLQQTIKQMNGIAVGEQMFEYLQSNRMELKEEIESEEIKQKAFNELLDAIKNNIQGILDLLPGNLSNHLLDAIKLEKYVYDDYQIYHATMDTINTFTQAYNVKINKLDNENMLLKAEYEKLFKEQQELLQQLDSLERKLSKEDLEKLSISLDDEFHGDEYLQSDIGKHSPRSNSSSKNTSSPKTLSPRGSVSKSNEENIHQVASPKSSKHISKSGKEEKKTKEEKKAEKKEEKEKKKKEKEEKEKEKKEKKEKK